MGAILWTWKWFHCGAISAPLFSFSLAKGEWERKQTLKVWQHNYAFTSYYTNTESTPTESTLAAKNKLDHILQIRQEYANFSVKLSFLIGLIVIGHWSRESYVLHALHALNSVAMVRTGILLWSLWEMGWYAVVQTPLCYELYDKDHEDPP